MKSSNFRLGVLASLMLSTVGKAMTFLVNLIVAYYFGASLGTDVYFFLMTLILTIANILITIGGTVLTPEFMRLEVSDGPRAAHQYVNQTCSVILSLLVVAAISGMLFPVELLQFFSNFTSDVARQHEALIRWSMLTMVLYSLSTLANELLLAKRFLVVPALVSIFNNAIVVLSLYFLSTTHLEIIFVANCIALVVSLSFQMYLLIRKEQWTITLGNGIKNLPYKQFGYVSLNIVASVVASFIPVYLLSGFAGAVTELSYAQRISEIPNSVVAIPFASVIAIRLNELYSRSETQNVNTAFIQAGQSLLFVLAPLSVCIFFYAPILTNVLFEKSALSRGSIETISAMISFLAISIPFIGVSYVTTRLMMSARLVKQGTAIQLIMTSVNALLVTLAVHFGGVVGYGWGYSCYQILYSVSLYFVLKRYLPFIKFHLLLKYTIILVLVTVFLFLSIRFALSPISNFLSDIVTAFITCMLFALSLLALNRIFKWNPQIASIQASFLHWLKR